MKHKNKTATYKSRKLTGEKEEAKDDNRRGVQAAAMVQLCYMCVKGVWVYLALVRRLSTKQSVATPLPVLLCVVCCTRASARCALLCSHARTAANCYTVQRNAARYEELQGATHRSTHTFVEYFEKRRKQIFRLWKIFSSSTAAGVGGVGAGAGAVRRCGHGIPERS
jgi:hypothetical protein